MVQIDYVKQMEHLGVGMSDAEKQDAIMNGIHNNIAALIGMLQHLEQRVVTLEEKTNELP